MDHIEKNVNTCGKSADGNENRKGSVTRKPGSNKLYLDFRYFGTRVVKSIRLKDTEENRETAREFLDEIMKDIEDGTFRFAEAFPNASPKELAFFSQREGGNINQHPNMS